MKHQDRECDHGCGDHHALLRNVSLTTNSNCKVKVFCEKTEATVVVVVMLMMMVIMFMTMFMVMVCMVILCTLITNRTLNPIKVSAKS